MDGIVYNTQEFTVHDGPGIRTEVFLKGCPMHCKWCSNPESWNPAPEFGFFPHKCLGVNKCGYCLKACPLGEQSPLTVENNAVVGVDTRKCLRCFRCVGKCYSGALKQWGIRTSVEEIISHCLADKSLFEKSGGGITLNGGEVMVQWEFALNILKRCREEGINTCVETSMECDPEILRKFYPYVDLMITDIKHMDSAVHKKYTGCGNECILRNIKMTVEAGVKLIIRTPVIPGVNNSEENFRQMGQFIRDELNNGIVQFQLLPYRKLGTEKYESLGRPYPMGEDYQAPERSVWEKNVLELTDLLKTYGVPAAAGSNSKLEL